MLKYILIVLFSLLISGYMNYQTNPEIAKKRRGVLFLLRFISLSLLLMLLLSPILYYTQHKNISPRILVLEDNSKSMELKHNSVTKAQHLKPLMQNIENKFSDSKYEVIHKTFANGLEGDANTTLLAPTLKELSKQKNLQNLEGIVLASDGWLRDESLSSVQQLGCPFYVLADSTVNPTPDIAIANVRYNRYAYRNEPNTIRAEISAQNYSGNAEIRFSLADKIISRQKVKLENGVTTSIDFTHRFNSIGFFPWKVEVLPLQGESQINNNIFPGAMEVLSEKQRIVLISDKPAWDNKFTLDAIATNARWTAESYLNRNGHLFSGETLVNKLDTNNLAAIIIINNGMLNLNTATAAFIHNAFMKGIGILYQGFPVSELADILPIQKSNITATYQGFLVPTPAAANYPMINSLTLNAKEIPPLDYYYVTASPGTEILATINNPQNSPAIVVQTIGTAHSIAFATLNLWRWQMQSGEEGYTKLISNCLTWLSNKSTGAYTAIYNNSYFQGEEIRIRLRNENEIRQSRLNANPQIRIMDKDKKEVFSDFLKREKDDYIINLQLSEPGTYSFEIADKESGNSTKGKFMVSDTSIETRDYGYNLSLLSWLANETGGKLLFNTNLESFHPVPAKTIAQISRKEIPLYKRWYVIALFIFTFCLELFFRRRWGLL
ncbi:MAG: hypothetical protein ABFC98_07310 [Candidatus Cloacimonas sp.]